MLHEHAWGGFWIFPMIIFTLMIIFILLSCRGGRQRWWYDDFCKRDSKRNDSALDILNQRYAKGEIDKEKYEEMKKDIQSSSTHNTPSQ